MHMLIHWTLYFWTNKILSADVKFSPTTLPNYRLSKYQLFDLIKEVQTNWFTNEEKNWPSYSKQVLWPRRFNISGQGGPTWWVIHHFLEAVIQAWTGTAWTRTRTSNFSTSFRFGFCSEVSELHGWSPDGHAKIINIFCEGVVTADPNREHVGPSSRVHSCQNLFVSVQKRNHHFDFTNFFACQHLFWFPLN